MQERSVRLHVCRVLETNLLETFVVHGVAQHGVHEWRPAIDGFARLHSCTRWFPLRASTFQWNSTTALPFLSDTSSELQILLVCTPRYHLA